MSSASARASRPAIQTKSPFGIVIPTTLRTGHERDADLSGSVWVVPRHRHGDIIVRLNVGGLDSPRARHDERKPNAPRRASMLTPELLHLVRGFLAEKLTRVMPMSVQGCLLDFRHFERWLYDQHCVTRGPASIGLAELNYALIEAYRRYCLEHLADGAAPVATLRSLYGYAVRHGIDGFDVKTLKRLRAAMRKDRRERSRDLHRDPYSGAFSWDEQVQIDLAIRDDKGSVQDRATILLFQQTGIRPDAAVLLTRRALYQDGDTNAWYLDVPRVKRGVASKEGPRTWRISDRLADLLLEAQPDGPPVPDVSLLHWLNAGNPYLDLGKRMRRWADEADLVTTRLAPDEGGWRDKNRKKNLAYRRGGPKRWSRALAAATKGQARLPVFPYRFRRTVATNLAELGATEYEITAILDDRSLAMAARYTTNTSAIVDVLERTLDRWPEWMETLHLFRGDIASDNDRDLPVVLGGAPQLADYTRYVDIGPIGQCTSNIGCTLNPPLSCYQCPLFRASKDTMVHVRQLEQVTADAGLGLESDRMALVLRRTAAAIAQVLKRLEGAGTRNLHTAIEDIKKSSFRRRTQLAEQAE